ncbi:MAG: PolC-type DNA polymerase III N-terminal domain-containing protein, partial [Dorea sp.]
MSKQFFEVFPTLKVNEGIQSLFTGVEVTKVATNSVRDYLRIHILSNHLIQKKYIFMVEKLVKDQLFAKTKIQIHVVEKYDLSEQYTPENLMNEYFDSFLLELDQKSVVERSMLQSAKYSFQEGNILCLKMTDSIVAQGKKESLGAYLQDVFENRFDRPIEVRAIYEAAKESKLKYNDIQIQQEIDAILDQVEAVKEEKELKKAQEEAKAEKKEEKQAVKSVDTSKNQSGKKSFQGGGSKDGPSWMKRSSDDPNLVYGRDFDDEPIELSQVVGEMGEITIRGKIISFDTREIRNEKTIVMFAVTDFTDTIMVKMFTRNEQLPDILAEVKKGAFLKIKGVTTIDKFDGELTIGSVTGIRKIADFTESRKDTAPEKRVELHCHSKMSDMDGVADVAALAKRAHDWGHKALAITDHGVVQGFTDANHFMHTLDKDDPFKIIYGVEGYIVDDLQDVAVNEKGQSLDGTFVVFDLETTGFSPIKD